MLKHLLVSRLKEIQKRFGLEDWEFVEELYPNLMEKNSREIADGYFKDLMDTSDDYEVLSLEMLDILRDSFKLSDTEIEELRAYSVEISNYTFPVSHLTEDQMFLIYFLSKKHLDKEVIKSIFKLLDT